MLSSKIINIIYFHSYLLSVFHISNITKLYYTVLSQSKSYFGYIIELTSNFISCDVVVIEIV